MMAVAGLKKVSGGDPAPHTSVVLDAEPKVVDADYSVSCDSVWAGAESYGVDFGEAVRIEELKCFFINGTSESWFGVGNRRTTLYTSDDNSSWQLRRAFVTGAPLTYDNSTGAWLLHMTLALVQPVTARYVKVTCTETAGNPLKELNGIELELGEITYTLTPGSERSVLIEGEHIAARAAITEDKDHNSRIVELIDRTIRQLGDFFISEPLFNCVASNTTNLTSAEWTTAKTTQAIELKDAEVLAVAVQYIAASGKLTAGCMVVPVVVSNNSNMDIIGLLQPKMFYGIKPYANALPLYSANTTFAPIQTWDMAGAGKVVLLVYWATGDLVTANVWAWPVSGGSIKTGAPEADIHWASKPQSG
jgi:hypothetical protein